MSIPRLYLLCGCLWAALASLHAQTPSDTASLALKEVVVSGVRETSFRENTLNITPLQADKIAALSAPTLAGALAQIPGVARMGTGQGIGKPVVRGLYGNRVLVLLDGLKFDNQQWQDEHGLGLSGSGVGRAEVVLGPASVLYGSEAVGGVINILSERPDPGQPGLQSDATVRYFTNSAGLSADYGIGRNTRKGWWQVRASAENHTDYTDGGGQRVLNSRFAAYNLRASLARVRPNSQTVFHATSSVSQFGFILEDLNDFFEPDARRSRRFEGPHHIVFLNIISAENTRFGEKSSFRINAGIQSNLRLEDEGAGQISLNMHLISLPWTLRWTRQLNRGSELILSATGALENNTNYGARIIVPDANMSEQGVSAFLRKKSGPLTLELGAGLGDKFIQTKTTRGLNTPDKELRPFQRNRASATGLAGLAWRVSDQWTIKWSAATGFRAPNLAELSSNGLHEGIFRYEIGRPDLRNEQNLNLDWSVQWNAKAVSAGFSVFANVFRDYIYLAPSGEDYFGFPVFRFRQNDAFLRGGEAFIHLRYQQWQWSNTGSLVRGTRSPGDENLPFIPAPKWVSRLEYSGAWGKNLPQNTLFAEVEQVFDQNNPAPYETATQAYALLHAGLSIRFRSKTPMTLWLVGRNLLDRRYFDHLSRLKNYGVYEPGRDLILSFKINF